MLPADRWAPGTKQIRPGRAAYLLGPGPECQPWRCLIWPPRDIRSVPHPLPSASSRTSLSPSINKAGPNSWRERQRFFELVNFSPRHIDVHVSGRPWGQGQGFNPSIGSSPHKDQICIYDSQYRPVVRSSLHENAFILHCIM